MMQRLATPRAPATPPPAGALDADGRWPAEAGRTAGRSLLGATWVRSVLLVGPFLTLIFGWFFLIKTDYDYWWHVRTGQLIWESGALPRTDPFSTTMAGAPWVTHEWASELLFYLVQRQWGYVGNTVLFGALAVVTFSLVWLTCRAWGVGQVGSTALMCIAFLISWANAGVRPQSITLLFLAATALVLTRYLRRQSAPLWLLPPLCLLWVNLHGGYVIGLALIGLTVFGELLKPLFREARAPLGPLLVVGALAALATLVNPHGIEAWLYPFSYAGADNPSMRSIIEWQSPNFHESYFLSLAASLLLALVLGMHRAPLSLTQTLWTLAFAFLALRSVRHVPLYAVIVMPLIGARLAHELPALRGTLATWRRPALLLTVWPCLLAVVLALAPRALDQPGGAQTGREPNPDGYPSGGVAYLAAHPPRGLLFNEYAWGGFLIYHLYPQQRVFIDGRADVYSVAVHDRYDEIRRLKPRWRELLAEYGVTTLLVPRTSPLAVVLSTDPGWEVAYEGPIEIVLVRRDA